MQPMGTQVTLDGYAGIRAEMEGGRLRDEALARAGLSVEEWTAAQSEWLERMSKEIEHDRFELTNRYAQAFVERQRALQAIRLQPAPLEAAPIQPAPLEVAPLEAAPIQPVPPEVAPLQMASFQLAPLLMAPRELAPLPAVPAAPRAVAMSTVALDGPIREAVPFQPDAAPSEQAFENAKRHAEALQGPARTPATGHSGATIDVGAAVRAQLPFGESSIPSPPVAAGQTVALGTPQPREVLPFHSGTEPAERALERAITHANLIQGPAGASGNTTSGATVDVGAMHPSPAQPRSTEIGSENTIALGAVSGAPSPVTAPIRVEPRPTTTGNETVAFPQAAAAGRAPAPPVAPAETQVPDLTVEQYAAACAEMSSDPVRAAAMFAKYGIAGKQAWKALTKQWDARLRADSQLRARWMALMTEIGKALKAKK
jgi:hypothetical protein